MLETEPCTSLCRGLLSLFTTTKNEGNFKTTEDLESAKVGASTNSRSSLIANSCAITSCVMLSHQRNLLNYSWEDENFTRLNGRKGSSSLTLTCLPHIDASRVTFERQLRTISNLILDRTLLGVLVSASSAQAVKVKSKPCHIITSIPGRSRHTHLNTEESKSILCSYWSSAGSDIHARVETHPPLHHTSGHARHRRRPCLPQLLFGSSSFESRAFHRRSDRAQAHGYHHHQNLDTWARTRFAFNDCYRNSSDLLANLA